MPLMNNILFSYNYINFHKKSPSLVNRPILKRIILSTIWHTKTHQGKALAQSVSISILLIKSFLYTFLLICLWDYYTAYINLSNSNFYLDFSPINNYNLVRK